MRRTGFTLLALLLAGAAQAQQVEDCTEVPPVTELVEPWEETGATLGEGAIRLALLHAAGEEGVRLLALTLPPVEEAEGEASEAALAPPERRCRIVAEGGLGFAVLDVAGIETAEDPEAGTLTARIPALRFIPESTELEELALVLTFGAADDSLTAVVEIEAPPEEAGEEAADEAPEGAGEEAP